jgi:hypothetical protein
MSKKLIMACMALVALAAFALPATASAANKPIITHPTGTPLPTPTKILATQIGNSTLSNTGNTSTLLTCSTATMTGELVKNTGGTIEGNISSAIFGGTGAKAVGEPHNECTGAFGFFGNTSVTTLGLPWCVRSDTLMVTDEFRISGGACGAAKTKIKFILNVTGASKPCEYEATKTEIKGTFTTHDTGDAILQITETNENAGFTLITKEPPSLCSTSGELHMKFTMETDTTFPDPLYISKLP